MKKQTILVLTALTLSSNAFAYTEKECLKDASNALQPILKIYLKALESIESADISETAKGAYLGIQDTTDAAMQNAINSFCKLQEQAKLYSK